jgi:hypothetical protein
VPWIDENLNPFTGDWISRTRLSTWNNGTWDDGKGGKERGKDYNHSSFNDLIITGLAGLRPRMDDTLEINPLLPADIWDWFCLDNLLYHGRIITILWDRNGGHYQRGQGLNVYVDGSLAAHSETISGIKVDMNAVTGIPVAFIEREPEIKTKIIGNTLRVLLPDYSFLVLSILDIRGRIVASQKCLGTKVCWFTLGNMNKGMYILKADKGDVSFQKKLVISLF